MASYYMRVDCRTHPLGTEFVGRFACPWAKTFSRNGPFAPRPRIDPSQSCIQVEIARPRPYRIGCPGMPASLPDEGLIRFPMQGKAVFLFFWMFELLYLKARVTDGKQADTEHTRFVPQYGEEGQVCHHHLPAQWPQ